MSEQERNELAASICREIDSTESIRNALRGRWDRNEQIYYCDETATALNTVEGIGNYGVSLWRPKCDKIVGEIAATITRAEPMVQCIEETPDGTNEGALEQALTQIAARARFSKVLPFALWVGANTNIGVIRARPVAGPDGLTGIDTDWFHPKHFMAYPSGFEHVTQCKTVGHRTYVGHWDIERLQNEGGYYAADVVAGDDPDAYDHVPGRHDRNDENDVVDVRDGYVEIWEVITRAKIGRQWRRVICTIAKSSQKLLSCQDYQYSRPWYEVVRFCQTEKRIFTNDSPANSVQGYCLASQDLMNAILAGAYATAYPPVWIKGYLGPQAAKKWSPGEVIPLGPEGEMGVLPIPFDAQKFTYLLEKFDRLVDSTIGVSANQTNERIPNMTATEASILAQAGSQRQATYMDAVGTAVEGVFSLYLEFLRTHFKELGELYGGFVAALDPKSLGKQFRIEVTGSTTAADPSMILQKLQMARGMAMGPQTDMDLGKLDARILDTLDLPFSVQSILRDDVSEWRGMFEELKRSGVDPMQTLAAGLQQLEASGQFGANQGDVPNPGMGAPPGVPPNGANPATGGIGAMLAGAPAGGPGGDPPVGPVSHDFGAEANGL